MLCSGLWPLTSLWARRAQKRISLQELTNNHSIKILVYPRKDLQPQTRPLQLPLPFATHSTMLGTLLRRNMSQKLSVLLLVFGLAWGLMLLRYTVQQPRHQSSAELREQILELSRQYVKVLTEENQNALGGPQGTSMAGYGKWLRSQECCFIVKKCTQALICIWFSFSSSCTQLIWRGL